MNLEQIKNKLNEDRFPKNWQDYARGLEDILWGLVAYIEQLEAQQAALWKAVLNSDGENNDQ